MEPDNAEKFTILFPHPLCMRQFDRAMAKCKTMAADKYYQSLNI